MKCKLCNQQLVIINVDGTKACTNHNCKLYSGKDLNKPNHYVKTTK